MVTPWCLKAVFDDGLMNLPTEAQLKNLQSKCSTDAD